MTDSQPQLCTPEENELMALARNVRLSMVGHDFTSSRVMIHNYDLLQSIMGNGSIGIGSVTGAWSQHMGELEVLLKDVETLMMRWRSGALTNDQFFAQRKVLFSQVETRLAHIGRLGSGLENRGKIKKILGISTKSYLHTGDLRAYAQNVRKVSTTAKVLSKGTYVGVALDVGVGALEIQQACSMAGDDACAKAKYVESGRIAGGILGSTVGGWAGGSVAGGICVALGVPSGGAVTLGCMVVGGIVGALGGGTILSQHGAESGTVLFSVWER